MADTIGCELDCEQKKANYDELIRLLSSDEIMEKHFAILELSEIKSQEDCLAMVSNLVGQDGKIREAVAHKIDELTQNPKFLGYFLNEAIFGILMQGIMDINGNVCRQIVGGELAKSSEFQKYLCANLPESIRKILNEIDENNAELKPFHQKRYVVSKRNFQLYWCLEALYNCVENLEFESIKDIIYKAGEFYDYTIREKIAKILTKIDNPELKELKEKLRNDENYYVRRFLIEKL